MTDNELKILIADDDADIREALSRLLAGRRLVTAADGAAALRLAASEKPALILLDVNMPGMSGLEVLRRLTASPRKPLVVMITAETGLETGVTALSLGIYAYLTKPLDPARVKETVAAALEEYARRNP